MIVLAQPTSEKGSQSVKERLNHLHEYYQDLMWIKTPQDREEEKKGRIKAAWEKLRGATKQMKEAAMKQPRDGRKKPILQINWKGIEEKRRLYAAKFTAKPKEEGG